VSEWQPIETAPRDGTRIDLWLVDEKGDGHREPDAYWVTDRYVDDYRRSRGKRDGWFAPNNDYDGMDGWCDQPPTANTHTGVVYFTQPTHWMPPPPPPAA
jgi:hypothetical protein